jgi:hypothetical protein
MFLSYRANLAGLQAISIKLQTLSPYFNLLPIYDTSFSPHPRFAQAATPVIRPSAHELIIEATDSIA